MKGILEKIEKFMELGGIRKDIALLAISGVAVVYSLIGFQPLPFDCAWIAIALCGLPIVTKAVIGLITTFDIKADVLVSLALIAPICIGETFAAGEAAFIMRLGSLFEELTVAKARDGIEKPVHLTPRTARVFRDERETIIPAEQRSVRGVYNRVHLHLGNVVSSDFKQHSRTSFFRIITENRRNVTRECVPE